ILSERLHEDLALARDFLGLEPRTDLLADFHFVRGAEAPLVGLVELFDFLFRNQPDLRRHLDIEELLNGDTATRRLLDQQPVTNRALQSLLSQEVDLLVELRELDRDRL